MDRRSRSRLVVAACVWAAAACRGAAGIDFAHDVVPILRAHCAGCHAGDARQGGYSINTRETTLAGGESGRPAVVPGADAESELLRRVTTSAADERMPAEADALPVESVAVLRAWIAAGAPWEDGFAFQGTGYEPPIRLQPVTLPPPHRDRDNPVDRIVDAYHADRGIPQPARCDDRTFIRRASLDLVGLLPDPNRVERFLADGDPLKRRRLVRELLDDPLPYAEHWLTFWNDLLRNDYTGTGFITGGRRQITGWLHRSLVDNKPYDVFVRELVAPPGDDSRGFIDGIVWRGEVNSSQTVPIQFAQNIGQSFLGINLKCASCHDSFVDRWTLRQTYDLAAIASDTPLELARCDQPTGVQASPAWLFGELGQVDPDAPRAVRLEQLAALVTSPDNGWLSRTLVNRLWHRLMGRGLVHPVDALRGRPWSPDLLETLATELATHDWDVKHVVETICASEAYGAVTPAVVGQPQPGDYVFLGPLPRRLTAEQFIDAVWQLTGDAPAKADADVRRTRPDPAAAPPQPPRAQWIWNNESAASPPGERLAFRARLPLPAVADHAVAVAAADNDVTMWINGVQVGRSTEWVQPFVEPAAGALRAGDNEIVVVAGNAAAGGPAALRAEVRVRTADGGAAALATDEAWEWTATLPDQEGRWASGAVPDWRPVAVVGNQATWAAADAAFAAGLEAGSGPQPMVRAALVKGTALMAALGRPNRDQVVTSRPADLTTLEAILLANEPGLAETFTRGGRRLLATHDGDAQRIVAAVCAMALSRPPTPGEAAALHDLLGPEPTAERVADVLWAVVMLPEFQFVR